MKPQIYLDHHASTPLDPRVLEAMMPVLAEEFANPSSSHAAGRRARDRLEVARAEVAALLGADPAEIVFTSGATESDNLALRGAAERLAERGRHLVTTQLEHRAVLDACRRLEETEGFAVSYVAPDAEGRLRLADFAAALRPDTVLASVILASNEIGTLQPLAEIGRLCRARGIVLHCDAVQALAWTAVDVERLQIDLLSISAHKMHGPKGVGALYVRRRPRVRLEPLLDGGGQERGLRPGTPNLPGIVGLGAAARLAAQEREADSARAASLRDRLLERLRAGWPELILNGSLRERLPNNLNVSFPGVDAAALVAALPDLAISSGSACQSGAAEASHVVRALGPAPLRHGGVLSAEGRASSAIRVGLGRFNTADEIERAATEILAAARHFGRQATPERSSACADDECG